MKRFAVILTIILILSACQPTPGKPVVIEKNDIEQKIMQTADPQQSPEIPDMWNETLNFQSGVQVVVEADIDRPLVAVFPVLEVKPHEVTQEEAQEFADFFMPGQQMYEYIQERTKADIEQDIIIVQSYLAEAKISSKYSSEEKRQLDIEMWTDQLNRLEKEYEQVPKEESEPKPTTIEFVTEDNPESGIYKKIAVEAFLGDISPAVFVVVILDNHESHLKFQNGNTRYGWDIDINDSLVGLNISMGEAKAIAERTLLDMGITDIELEETEAKAEIKLTDDTETISTAADDSDRKKCFVFHYIPVHEGISITNVEPCYGMETEEVMYDRPWACEEIIISVNDSGVISFQWDSPGDIVRTVNENVLLKDFEEIKEIFRKQMFYQRTWTFPGIQENGITVKTIKLGYMRVKVKDENKYYMLPVWDFIGDWTYTARGQENSIENVSFLTLNAIDGSVIDRYLGY